MKLLKYLKFIFQRILSFNKKIYFSNLAFSNNSKFEGKNSIGSFSRITNSSIGFGSYVGKSVVLNNSYIGRYCSIGNNIKVNVGKHPTEKFVSTSPAFYSPLNDPINKLSLSYINEVKFSEQRFTDNNYSLEIGNDVWIGNDARFIEGIIISDGAIIASGSLVTKDIPPYSIVAGVPARIIKYRFKKEEIEFLLKLRWWNNKEEWIINHAEYFENINTFMELIKNEKNIKGF